MAALTANETHCTYGFPGGRVLGGVLGGGVGGGGGGGGRGGRWGCRVREGAGVRMSAGVCARACVCAWVGAREEGARGVVCSTHHITRAASLTPSRTAPPPPPPRPPLPPPPPPLSILAYSHTHTHTLLLPDFVYISAAPLYRWEWKCDAACWRNEMGLSYLWAVTDDQYRDDAEEYDQEKGLNASLNVMWWLR